MKRIHCEAVDRNQYWVAFQEEEEEENGCITGKWGRGRENLWKSWRHMNWEKAADETTAHCSAGAGEVEVREITGVLAHDIHLLRVLASDIHLLNLKSKAKCTFEAAGWGISEYRVSWNCCSRHSPRAPTGWRQGSRLCFSPVENHMFQPEILTLKLRSGFWNQSMTKI